MRYIVCIECDQADERGDMLNTEKMMIGVHQNKNMKRCQQVLCFEGEKNGVGVDELNRVLISTGCVFFFKKKVIHVHHYRM